MRQPPPLVQLYDQVMQESLDAPQDVRRPEQRPAKLEVLAVIARKHAARSARARQSLRDQG